MTEREWRLGEHYRIHVYEDQRPVATFFEEADAKLAVEDHNDIDALRSAIREAKLRIDLWRSGDERGADADVIAGIQRDLEVTDD